MSDDHGAAGRRGVAVAVAGTCGGELSGQRLQLRAGSRQQLVDVGDERSRRSPPHYAEHANCPYRLGGDGGKADQEGGLSTTDALGLSSGAPPGTSAGWTFTAPSGTTITAITYERYIGHTLDPNNSWSPGPAGGRDASCPAKPCLDSVQNGETCFVGGPPGEGGEPGVVTGLSAHELSSRRRVPSARRRGMRHRRNPSTPCGRRCTARR